MGVVEEHDASCCCHSCAPNNVFKAIRKKWGGMERNQRLGLIENITDEALRRNAKTSTAFEKPLNMLWDIAQVEETLSDGHLNRVLHNHTAIIDHASSFDRLMGSNLRVFWLEKCVDVIRRDGILVLPILKYFREICCQCAGKYQPKSGKNYYRSAFLEKVEKSRDLTHVICNNLLNYTIRARQRYAELSATENPPTPSTFTLPRQNTNHVDQISERLIFLKFAFQESELLLKENDAKIVWSCLIASPVFPSDKQNGFQFFVDILTFDSTCALTYKMEKSALKNIFLCDVSSVNPTCHDDLSLACVDLFLKAINFLEGRLVYEQNSNTYRPVVGKNHYDLFGLDYLCRIILKSDDSISDRAVNLIIEVCESEPVAPPCKTDEPDEVSFDSFDLDDKSVISLDSNKSTKKKQKRKSTTPIPNDDLRFVFRSNSSTVDDLETETEYASMIAADESTTGGNESNLEVTSDKTSVSHVQEKSSLKTRIVKLEEQLADLKRDTVNWEYEMKRLSTRYEQLSEENVDLKKKIDESNSKLKDVDKSKKTGVKKIMEECDSLKEQLAQLQKDLTELDERLDMVKWEKTAFEERMLTLQKEKNASEKQKACVIGSDTIEDDQRRVVAAEATVLALQKNFNTGVLEKAVKDSKMIVSHMNTIIPKCSSLTAKQEAIRYRDAFQKIVIRFEADIEKMKLEYDMQIKTIEATRTRLASLKEIKPPRPPTPPPLLEFDALSSVAQSTVPKNSRLDLASFVQSDSPPSQPISFNNSFRNSERNPEKSFRTNQLKEEDGLNTSFCSSPSWTSQESSFYSARSTPPPPNTAIYRPFNKSFSDWTTISASPTKTNNLNQYATPFLPTDSSCSTEFASATFGDASFDSQLSDIVLNPTAAPFVPSRQGASSAFSFEDYDKWSTNDLESLADSNDFPLSPKENNLSNNVDDCQLDAADLIKYAIETGQLDDNVDFESLKKSYNSRRTSAVSSSSPVTTASNSKTISDGQFGRGLLKEKVAQPSRENLENFNISNDFNSNSDYLHSSSSVSFNKVTATKTTNDLNRKEKSSPPPGFKKISCNQDANIHRSCESVSSSGSNPITSENFTSDQNNVQPFENVSNNKSIPPRPPLSMLAKISRLPAKFQQLYHELFPQFPLLSDTDLKEVVAQYRLSLPEQKLTGSFADLKNAVEMFLILKYG